jgi:hypothetical protein
MHIVSRLNLLASCHPIAAPIAALCRLHPDANLHILPTTESEWYSNTAVVKAGMLGNMIEVDHMW